MLYKLLPNDRYTNVPANCILRVYDNAYVPLDEGNMDYREYQAWLAEGNTPLPADTPLTAAEV